MADSPELAGAPITIGQDDGSSKVYDAGLLAPEAQQAVALLAFINQFRQVLNTSSQVYRNIVNSNLNDEAMIEEIKSDNESEATTTTEDTKD